MKETNIRYYGRKLTKAAMALAERLDETNKPIVTPYELYLHYRQLFFSNATLNLREKFPNVPAYERARKNLARAKILAPDPDYGYRAYRVLNIGDSPADEICCIVDPFCYVSHLSAMQRYGITNRRPKALHLTRPNRHLQHALSNEKMLLDYNGEIPVRNDEYIPLKAISHPPRVRGREISAHESATYGSSNKIRGTNSRVATVGQTFLDTLQNPKLCGGMHHVIDVWREYAASYLEEIVGAIDECEKPIVKIRAGYILEEFLNITDTRISGWQKFAGRGSSRVLDPEKSFSPNYSEKWMLSLNV